MAEPDDLLALGRRERLMFWLTVAVASASLVGIILWAASHGAG